MLTYYPFWLAVVSLLCVVAERAAPWRRGQLGLRPELGQDVFWLCFNGYFASLVFAGLFGYLEGGLTASFTGVCGVTPQSLRLLEGLNLALQIAVVLVASDFIEWLVHNALHRFPPLWRIHRVHHSIETMDWIGNFRFHWGELIVYKSVKYIPLALLGARWEALLVAAVVATLIGHLNHANLNLSWGPLRYILNSPRMHIWHHDKHPHRPAGVNFGVVFSLWDWIFGTAYMPREARQPEVLGYVGMEHVSHSLIMRFLLPMFNRRTAPDGNV
ncbi:MAG: sterol desaturase family protein [Lentisphaerae bacterium]|nr:sterol desaturase family protein [Lentisphaerota bacterium]